jgi:hypothetical protein
VLSRSPNPQSPNDIIHLFGTGGLTSYGIVTFAGYYFREGWGDGQDKFLVHYEGEVQLMS